MVLYMVGIEVNYFVDMYWLLNHWTSGEMGWFPIYPTIFGVVCLVILVIPRKWVDYVLDEISFFWWNRTQECGGVYDDEESMIEEAIKKKKEQWGELDCDPPESTS